MTTRRELITSGLGLAAIIAAGKAPAAFIKSAIAARSGMGGVASDPNPYADPSLWYMFDGIWNNGIEKPHVSAIDTSVGLFDCNGNSRISVSAGGAYSTYESNCWFWNAQKIGLSVPAMVTLPTESISEYTIEMVASIANPLTSCWFYLIISGSYHLFPYNSNQYYVSGSGFTMPSAVPYSSSPFGTPSTKWSYVITAKNGEQKVYVNGALFATGTKWFSAGAMTRFWLGGYSSQQAKAGRRHAIRFYTKALDEATVIKHYNIDNERFGIA